MGPVILCATDAGGAANLAPLVPVLRARGVPVEVITRPSLAHVFEGVRVMPPPPETPAAMARAIAARAIVCGTTCFESVDRHFVAAGRRLGIRTTVVLDERYDYSARFVVDAAPVWPDAVTVLDAASVDEAEAEGVPRGICHVTGGPALAHVAEQARRSAAAPGGRPASLQGLPPWPIVVFVSETIGRDYGSAPGSRGPLGPYLGFTEEDAHAALLSAIEPSGPAIVVEKLHPASELPERPPHAAGNLLHVRLKREPLWPLLRAAHAVVGMRSVGLLEAALLGVPATSYQPGVIGPERCTAVRLGVVPRFTSTTELGAWCRARLAAPAGRSPVPDFAFADPAAPERVVDVALRDVA